MMQAVARACESGDGRTIVKEDGRARVCMRAGHGIGAGRAEGSLGNLEGEGSITREKPAWGVPMGLMGPLRRSGEGWWVAPRLPRAVRWPANVVSFQPLQSRPETMKGRPNGEPYGIPIRCMQIPYAEG